MKRRRERRRERKRREEKRIEVKGREEMRGEEKRREEKLPIRNRLDEIKLCCFSTTPEIILMFYYLFHFIIG